MRAHASRLPSMHVTSLSLAGPFALHPRAPTTQEGVKPCKGVRSPARNPSTRWFPFGANPQESSSAPLLGARRWFARRSTRGLFALGAANRHIVSGDTDLRHAGAGALARVAVQWPGDISLTGRAGGTPNMHSFVLSIGCVIYKNVHTEDANTKTVDVQTSYATVAVSIVVGLGQLRVVRSARARDGKQSEQKLSIRSRAVTSANTDHPGSTPSIGSILLR